MAYLLDAADWRYDPIRVKHWWGKAVEQCIQMGLPLDVLTDHVSQRADSIGIPQDVIEMAEKLKAVEQEAEIIFAGLNGDV